MCKTTLAPLSELSVCANFGVKLTNTCNRGNAPAQQRTNAPVHSKSLSSLEPMKVEVPNKPRRHVAFIMTVILQ